MSIVTRGFGGGGSLVTVGFGIGLSSFLPDILANYYPAPAYEWVIDRGYLEITDVKARSDHDLQSVVARVKLDDISLREWETVLERSKGTIPVRSPGWPDEYE